ncbi:DUF177 domain-containing protein [Marivita sp. GX14005]|uniref:YceD family protein n=1 Tax=Marivita sp. GX14005 TaxID=2942276 RepID=UPI0020190089|nr:DUF177 domain-containing protein [Marivita sp. GX14005]MCL3882827.1 DUF177 domain-containing protein [Marivita sp. GX14005]
MSQQTPKSAEFRVSALSTRQPTAFDLDPSPEERQAIAEELGISALKKLRFQGQIAADGARGWLLTAQLGATVVQPCVVTLALVTTRLDEDVRRSFVPPEQIAEPEDGSETEMPEDTTLEPLGRSISVWAVMMESLSLALPDYPRAPDAELGEAVFAEEGVAPMRDEETKPFSGLAALREKLDKNGG